MRELKARWFTESDWRLGERPASGVAVNGCFIVGADGETQESLESLIAFILNSPFAEVQVTVQTPFPGASLHRSLAAEGRLLMEQGWSAYTLFDVTYRPERCVLIGGDQ